jgi:hypothetical protein
MVMIYFPTVGIFYSSGDQDPSMVIAPPLEQFGNNTTFKVAPYENVVRFSNH